MMKLSALVAAVLVLASCSEWNEPESLDVVTPEIDAGLETDYLNNLKAYKAGAHKVLFAGFENSRQAPAGQAQHLTVLPDSVDYIVLNNPDDLSDAIVSEMEQVRRKGTQVIYDINFPALETAWLEQAKADPSLTEEEAVAYFTGRTSELLALCDRWGYDGVMFTYIGRSPVSLTEEEKAVYSGRQAAFMDAVAEWKTTHAGQKLVFAGNPQYLLDENRGLLAECDYIVVATDAAANINDLTVRVMAAVGAAGVPDDRIVVCAQTTRPGDDKMQYGYFGSLDENGNPVRQVYGSARWVSLPSSGFTRAGLLVRDAQYDYYDAELIYRNIREAIGIMNPSPKN